MKPACLLLGMLGASGCIQSALGGIEPGVEGRVYSMITTCEVGTVEDIVMPTDSLVIAVLNVSPRDAPSDGGAPFDLLEPMSGWAQSTGRFLNVTCETDEILIFYMEET